MDRKDIEHRFAFHAASTEEKKMAHTSVRQKCLDLALYLNETLPADRPREIALVMTGLEEVMFWGNAAHARSQLGKEPE